MKKILIGWNTARSISLSLSVGKRHRVALELLESERVYVSQLSLLLKANITFNGSDAFSSKDKR